MCRARNETSAVFISSDYSCAVVLNAMLKKQKQTGDHDLPGGPSPDPFQSFKKRGTFNRSSGACKKYVLIYVQGILILLQYKYKTVEKKAGRVLNFDQFCVADA